MKILLNNFDLNEALYGVSNIGFVPTMGTLHKGHISLIKKSLNQCNKTIVSIFINPTQFNNINDYKRYPRNKNKDLKILKKLKVNFVYLPNQKEIYKVKNAKKIILNKNDKILCAKYRKGHFEGVIDIMRRLTNNINPRKVFMGEKDFQQLYLVKKYLKKNHKIKIVSCKTIRNKNKLALSSRNLLLNKLNLEVAANIYKQLINTKKNIKKKKNILNFLNHKKIELINNYKIKIDYLELRNKKNLNISKKTNNSRLFIAYYLNNVRLIDNI